MIEIYKDVVNIKGKPFEYDRYNLTSENVPVITLEQAKDILFTTKHLFDEKGISFFLIFGTLLGAVREKNFISHDYDVDIATSDYEKVKECIPEWHSKGFKVCRYTDHFMSFMKDGVYIDVYRYLESTPKRFFKSWCCQIDKCIMPKKFFKKFITIDFLGENFNIPLKSEELMRWIYGKDWKTPIKGKHGIYDVRILYYTHKTTMYIARYINRRKIKSWLRLRN